MIVELHNFNIWKEVVDDITYIGSYSNPIRNQIECCVENTMDVFWISWYQIWTIGKYTFKADASKTIVELAILTFWVLVYNKILKSYIGSGF